MKEKITNVKNFVMEHRDDCALAVGLTAATLFGFVSGRSSARCHMESICTWTDKNGVIIKEKFIGIRR